jgi:hypothetical protein
MSTKTAVKSLEITGPCTTPVRPLRLSGTCEEKVVFWDMHVRQLAWSMAAAQRDKPTNSLIFSTTHIKIYYGVF